MENITNIAEGEKYRIYGKIKREIVTQEKVPAGYGKEIVLLKGKKPSGDAYSANRDSKGNKIPTRLNAEPYHLEEVITQYSSSVFPVVRSVESMVRTPFGYRISFGNHSAIELRVGDGRIYATRYKENLSVYEKDLNLVRLANGVKLGENVRPEQALENARAGLCAELKKREKKKRAEEMYTELAKYSIEQINLRETQFRNTYGISQEGIDSGILKALKIQENSEGKLGIVAHKAKKRNNGETRMPSENEISPESLNQLSEVLSSEFYDVAVGS